MWNKNIMREKKWGGWGGGGAEEENLAFTRPKKKPFSAGIVGIRSSVGLQIVVQKVFSFLWVNFFLS